MLDAVASARLEPVTRTFDDGLIAEHQAKQLFAAAGIPVTRGEVAALVDEVHDPFGLKGVDHRGRFVP